MSREKELAKNTIILSIGKICTQFVSFLLLPLYTALLMPEDYGIVDLFSTYVTLLVPIFNWQFENGLFRFMLDCRKDKEKQAKLFSTVFIVNICQVVGFAILYLIFNRYITSEYKLFLALDVGLNIFLNTLLQLPRGLGNNTAYAIGSFISASSAVVFNVILIAGFRMGALGMFWATVASKFITVLYLAFSQKIWRLFKFRFYENGLFKELLRYSVPLIPNQLSWWIMSASDRTIVSTFVSVAANGVYSVANKFSSVFVTFYNIFYLSWTESVSLHINDEDRDDFLTDTINSIFKLFSSVCIGIIACMPFAFPLLINEKYGGAYNQIPILMVAVLFQVIVGLYSVIYVALKKSAEIAKTSFYAAIINIVVDLVLIKFIGIYAASVSTLVAFMSMAFYRYYHVKRFVSVPLYFKNNMITLSIGLVVVISYYYRNLIICGIVMLVTVMYSILFNKDFLRSTLQVVLAKFKKKTNKQ